MGRGTLVLKHYTSIEAGTSSLGICKPVENKTNHQLVGNWQFFVFRSHTSRIKTIVGTVVCYIKTQVARRTSLFYFPHFFGGRVDEPTAMLLSGHPSLFFNFGTLSAPLARTTSVEQNLIFP